MTMTEQLNKTEAAPSNTVSTPTREEIAVRAYHLWEKAGKPQARELECWLQAEAELRLEGQKRFEAVVTMPPFSRPQRKASRTSTPLKLTKIKRRFSSAD